MTINAIALAVAILAVAGVLVIAVNDYRNTPRRF